MLSSVAAAASAHSRLVGGVHVSLAGPLSTHLPLLKKSAAALSALSVTALSPPLTISLSLASLDDLVAVFNDGELREAIDVVDVGEELRRLAEGGRCVEIGCVEIGCVERGREGEGEGEGGEEGGGGGKRRKVGEGGEEAGEKNKKNKKKKPEEKTGEKEVERKLTLKITDLSSPTFALDLTPLSTLGSTVASTRKHSKAYVHHLVKCGEMLGTVLLHEVNVAAVARLAELK